MAQQAQQQGGGDNSLAVVWIMALLMITIFLIWKYAHQHIVAFVFKLNIWQAQVITFFIHDPKLENNIFLMKTIDPAAVDWNQFLALTRSVGDYLRYPIIVILVVMALILYFSNISLKFRKAHDMKSLRAQEQYNWSAIMPVVNEDLVGESLDQGPWAMALSPMEFARKYDLLKKEDVLANASSPGLEMTAGIRRGDAKRVFTLQLGPYFEGFNKCPPHVVALAAVFMARINRDREGATAILSTINKSFTAGKPDYSAGRAILKKYHNTPLVQEAIGSHAYLLTVMASLLEAAREDGVVPSAEFLWLKPVDRRLWYMLNSVGRQTPYAEVAGPFAHWIAEKAMGRRSLVPMIDEAIKALEGAVKEVKLTHKELRELKP